MRKGVHTTTQPRHAGPSRLKPYLFITGIVLIWTTGTVLGQESEAATRPEQAAEAAGTEDVAPETPPAAEPNRQEVDPERQWQERIEELTQRRERLEEAAGNIERQLQESESQQEQRRRELRDQLEEIRSQIRQTDEQTMELQRERLRRNYLQELEALEEAHRQQLGVEPGMSHPPGIEDRMLPWRRDLIETTEGLRQELREIQEQGEQDGNRWRELREHLSAMTERLCSFDQRLDQAQRGLDEGRTEQQALSQRQTDAARGHEELRRQIGQVSEQQRAMKERTGALSSEFRQDIDRLCTDLQRMGQTVGRIEQERLEAETGLKTQIGQLCNQVQALQTEQAKTQGALNWILSQSDRSTVGSAGRSWGW